MHAARSTVPPVPETVPDRVTAVLLDLDGTISRSGDVIAASMLDTCAALGLPAFDASRTELFIGPPVRDNLATLARVPEPLLDEAIALYRGFYRTRAHEAPPYPGMVEAVRTLREAGLPLAVATSKALDIARDALADLGILDLFVTVQGSLPEDDWSTPKADVVAMALAALREAGVDVGGAVMVGDRVHDVTGAAAHGLPTVYVTWGYGGDGESAGAAAVVHDAGQLLRVLGVGADA